MLVSKSRRGACAFFCAFAIAAVTGGPSSAVAQPKETPRARVVVALYGGEYNSPSSLLTNQVLRHDFGSDTGEVEIFSEYIDSARFEGSVHERRLASFLRGRYAERTIDLLFATDPFSLRFLIQYRDEIAPGAPVIFANVRKTTLARLSLPADFVGVPVELDARPTVKLALTLRPSASELVIVTGDDPLGRIWESRLREAAAALAPTLPLRVLTGLAIGEVERELAGLAPQAAVFCGEFRRDGAGRSFPGALYVLERLAAVSKAPIFHVVDADAAVGRGALAGVSIGNAASAHQAVAIAKTILAGTPATAVDLPAPLIPRPYVDWRELRRWGVPESLVPADSVVMFREPSIWEQYSNHVLAVVLGLALQSGLIAGLLFQRHRRRRAELEAAHQRKQLERLTRITTLGSLSTSIAHELNQPLTAILANAQAVRRFIANGPVDLLEIGDALDDIVADNKRAGEIISSLRKMLAKEQVLHQPLAIGEVARDALKLLHYELLNRGTTVTLEVADDCPLILGARVPLQQVIVNLVLNACDSMQQNADRDKVVVLRAVSLETGIRVSVEDNGCGVPRELIADQFMPFTSNKDHGMGLGLTVSSWIIANHGGQLRATNNADRGATFAFDLPAVASKG